MQCTIERSNDGSVTMQFSENGAQVLEYTCPPNIFASIICNASAGGEMDYRFYTAMKFLKSTGPIDVVGVPPTEAGLNPHCHGEAPQKA